MTFKNEINKFIRQVMEGSKPSEIEGILYYQDQIIQVAKLVAAKEREACAKICEDFYTGEEARGDWPPPDMCAEAIRARDETTSRGEQ